MGPTGQGEPAKRFIADRRRARYPPSVEAAVFLDRDNTLIANEGDLGDPEQVRLIDGVAPALGRLHDAGYRLIVVSNQGGVARGKFSEEDVDAVNQRIAELIGDMVERHDLIERFYYCPFHPQGTVEHYRRDHPWRKPNPGMLLQAGQDMALDLGRSWLIGDQARDITAGQAAGCRTILVSNDGKRISQAKPSAAVETFPEAVRLILSSSDSDGDDNPPSPTPVNPTTAISADNSPPDVDGPTITALESRPSDLRRAILDLTDELRSQRQRRGELTSLRMIAGVAQLLVLLLALLGLLQLGQLEVFITWMLGAALLQMLVITLVLFDLRS